ncbi:PTS N-acetylgalactosamine transporter subunit IIC [Clostridium butyricum]|uniref:PTS N-acetylgalactosamine transporter subunit IIC n=1 Tax=Clostridium butyricum TaxID=1492 RepID=A0A512TLJ3_CLOBU|nr:PTS sugar transporter subunit IIC [Clostridium butyricum]NOW23890.1 PTS system N-acetylgalactosamine-specific IIC component [Clostridium butyricum]GEQ21086.1 PTS N-acetylgalactosamine transporter subunit IIC [Clostridium butyricum]
MEISLTQAILIGLITAFCYAGQLLGIYTNRSIIMAFFVGLVSGDIPTALTFGALAELAFMGFGVGAGGTVPPNQLGPGIVGTIMAITLKNQGVTPESALSLSFPFAVLFQLVTTAIYTALSGTTDNAKKLLKQGKYGKFNLLANSTVIAFLVVGFIIGIISAVSLPALQSFVNVLPQWLIKGLSIAGGLIPAIGFAMIMSVMLKKEFIPYVLLGYICVSYLQLPTMAIALAGTVFALIVYNLNSNNAQKVVAESYVNVSDEEDFSNGI